MHSYWTLSHHERGVWKHQTNTVTIEIWRSPMVNLCRFKNGEFSFGSTMRLHKIPMFPLLLGQQSCQGSLG